MIEHVRLCVEHGVECCFVAVEIRNQHFDLALGIQGTYLSNRLGPVCGAAIRQIVPIHGRDNCVSEIQMIHSFRDVTRLFSIERARQAFTDRAEPAMTRADVAAQHERRGAIGPTLKNVGTTGFLADGVQVKSFNQLQHLVLRRWVAETNAQPLGLGFTDLLKVADYSEFAGQLITSVTILRIDYGF